MTPDPASPAEASSKTRLRLWLRLLKLTSWIEADLRRKLRDDHDTTLPRFDVMAALARHPQGLKMSDLSRYLKVSNGNVTGIVDRLAEDGLALRLAVPGDKRANLARLTAKGITAFDALAGHHENWVNDLLGGLTADESQTLAGLVEKALNQTEASDDPS